MHLHLACLVKYSAPHARAYALQGGAGMRRGGVAKRQTQAQVCSAHPGQLVGKLDRLEQHIFDDDASRAECLRFAKCGLE